MGCNFGGKGACDANVAECMVQHIHSATGQQNTGVLQLKVLTDEQHSNKAHRFLW